MQHGQYVKIQMLMVIDGSVKFPCGSVQRISDNEPDFFVDRQRGNESGGWQLHRLDSTFQY